VPRPNAASYEATVLAFDFGTRRIGVAVGNTLLRIARPLTTIAAEANAPRFAAVAALVETWHPDVLVVGRPVHADGTPHEVTSRAERFARQLKGRFGIEVALVDERYTTEEAETALSQAGVRADERNTVRDQVAAQLILQAWFDDTKAKAHRGAA
jgi:putative Holliday junction resolvase